MDKPKGSVRARWENQQPGASPKRDGLDIATSRDRPSRGNPPAANVVQCVEARLHVANEAKVRKRNGEEIKAGRRTNEAGYWSQRR